MASSVSRTLLRIKDDLRGHLSDELIEGACHAAGHRWRRRKFGPVETIHLFVVQVLAFNTAITHLRHLAGHAVNAAAYCKARMRLPLAVLQQLLVDSAAVLRQSLVADGGRGEEPGRWCGLRAWLVDGSSTITPDLPGLQKAFTQPKGCKAGCGLPVPKVLGLFDAYTGLIVQMLAFPLYTHEQSKVWHLHPLLGAADLLVGDCGFCSYAHLAMLHLRRTMGLFRIHQRQIVDYRPHRKPRHRHPSTSGRARPTSTFVERLGKHDQIVRWKRPAQKSKWMTPAQHLTLPAELPVRELTYRIPCRGQRTRHGDDRDDAARSGPVPQGENRRVVRRPLACGDTLRPVEDDAEDAQAQEPDRGRRAQGAGGLLRGVQPGPRGDGASRTAAGRDAGPDQLHRRRPLAAVGITRRAGACAGGESAPPRPPRTASQEGSKPKLPGHDQAPRRAAQSITTTEEATKVNAIRPCHLYFFFPTGGARNVRRSAGMVARASGGVNETSRAERVTRVLGSWIS